MQWLTLGSSSVEDLCQSHNTMVDTMVDTVVELKTALRPLPQNVAGLF